MSWIDKLKHEWKTASVASLATLVGFWDAGASAFDWTPIVPDGYKQYVPLTLGSLFLALRRWKPKDAQPTDGTSEPSK